jgi:hypothetical protein
MSPDANACATAAAWSAIRPSAIAARKSGKGLPDVFVFRYPSPPTITLDSADRAEIESQWTADRRSGRTPKLLQIHAR